MHSSRLYQMFLLLFLSITLSACGKDFVKDAKLESRVDKGEVFMDFQSQVNISKYFAIGSLPIYNPARPGTVIGYLSLRPNLKGQSTLGISLSVTQLLNLNRGFAPTLPNGEQLPIAGLGNRVSISLPIPGGHRVYVMIDPVSQDIVLGAALVIPGMKPLPVKNAGSLFMPFAFNGVTGLAGIFLGPSAGETGFGIFVDASAMYKHPALQQTNLTSLQLQPSTWTWSAPATSEETRQGVDTILSGNITRADAQ